VGRIKPGNGEDDRRSLSIQTFLPDALTGKFEQFHWSAMWNDPYRPRRQSDRRLGLLRCKAAGSYDGVRFP
jgi:hypothetical protein